MFSSLFANILYPFLATLFVLVVDFDVNQPFAPQFAGFGTDLCVLALGSIVGIINNPLLLAKWGSGAINLGFGLGLFDAILVVATIKVRQSKRPSDWQAKTNVTIGVAALTAISTINVASYW